MYTSTLLAAAFAAFAFAGEQAEACAECDAQQHGQGGGSGGSEYHKQSGGYNGGGYTGKWRQKSHTGGGQGGVQVYGSGGGSDYGSPCQNGQTDQHNGYQLRCSNAEWQYNNNGQWYSWSSSSSWHTESGGGGGGSGGSSCSNGASQNIIGHTMYCQNGIWSVSSSWTSSGGGGGGGFSSGKSGQVPLQFDNTQYKIPINQLHEYKTECSKIEFPQDNPCDECGDFNVQQIKCQAFGDAQGHNPIGDLFGYQEGCDFGKPTQVYSLLCTIS